MPFHLDETKVSEFVLKLRESGSKETTIKSYEASLKRVLNTYEYSPINLVNTEEFVKVINEDGRTNTNKSFSLNTKKLIYATILKYLAVMGADDELRAEWDDLYATIKSEVLEIEKKNELKDGEKEKFMDYDKMRSQFINYLEEVEYGEEDDTNWDRVMMSDPVGHFLLANLLLLPAPTRLGNYREMKKIYATVENYKEKLAEMDETSNYIVIVKLKTKTMYVYRFADYKTADAVGEVVVNVEERLLKRVVGTVALKPKLWEQVVKASQPQQTKKLNALTKRVFDKEFSVDLIRHAYITWLYSNKPTAKQKEEALKIFGNKYNPTTADLYYRKV
jgi:hypothetical protein